MYQITFDRLIMAQGETRADCIEQLAHATFPTIVKIEKQGYSQVVTVRNEIWKGKETVLPQSYSHEYNRREILNDIAEKICFMNGYQLQKLERK